MHMQIEVSHEWRENVVVNGETFGLLFNATRKQGHVTANHVLATREGNLPAILLPDMDAPGTWDDAYPILIGGATQNLRHQLAGSNDVRHGGAVLVGMFLVTSVETGTAGANGVEWRSTWCLHRSPSGNGRDWQRHELLPTAGSFTKREHAVNAGMEAGIIRAREIQGNESLQPQAWRLPFPEVEPYDAVRLKGDMT
ncbi:hypothetical protein [Dyella nitratireducens]|uniref:Uncharacterized protein n=2 Tax=Dyella nitratireducens TaxID=1849580 RepID=A0ABQ1FNP3_9GAMM|nr:hypothetical protein [Dyella nitratireducens]GGA21933.1 hypothetical protein GCM10010981_07600 [Dyella nitratireducens]GLQ44179.1 hypothetical protein GCM10007902_40290 [Dyella nitratireducens]